MAWSEHELDQLKKLAISGQYFYSEIAKRLGRKEARVRHQARRLKLPGSPCPHRMGKWNSKHSHIRKAAMTYFLTHTWDETQKRFGLTKSELKSLFSVGYTVPELKHLRKETRLHSSWSADELKFLLQHAGLRPRKWIMEKLKRGKNVCHIKERLQALGLSSRTMQGITLSQYRKAFGHEPKFFLQTDAGPNGGLKTSPPIRWKIIPWVWLDQELKAKRLKTSKEFRILVSARAMFQEWIFEGSALKKMKRIVKECQ